MTERVEHRYEVTFTASEALDGRPVIALALDQEGQAAAGEDSVFFLELDPAIAPEATSRIAAFLGQYIKGFGVMTRTPPATQDLSKPEEEIGTTVPHPDALEDDAARRKEPEPNPEGEGQPVPLPQIDGVKEGEAEEPQSRDEKAEGPVWAE
jgi:hypothetical protein